MNDYIELRIDASPCSEELTDLLAAFLADEGYESFVPDKTGLTAYVRRTDFNSTKVDELLECFLWMQTSKLPPVLWKAKTGMKNGRRIISSQ